MLTIIRSALLALLPLAMVPRMFAAEPSGISSESEFHFSLVGDSKFKDGGQRGRVGAFQFGAREVLSIPTHGGPLIRAGVDYQRIQFSVPDSVRFPGKLQTAALVLGADFQLGEAWIFRLEIEPGFYGSRASLRAEDFNVPIILGGSYFVSADLQLIAGISIDVNRKYPVLPGVGVRWKFATDWVLNAILPNPRIEYSVNKSLLLYAGADLLEATYRMDGDFGDDSRSPKLHNAVADYTQIRIGGGASWKVDEHVTLDLEAGCVAVHELDYHRADLRVRSTGAPAYGGVTLKVDF